MFITILYVNRQKKLIDWLKFGSGTPTGVFDLMFSCVVNDGGTPFPTRDKVLDQI